MNVDAVTVDVPSKDLIIVEEHTKVDQTTSTIVGV